ncbi:MAG: alkaline phosphatase family protein [Chloroflexaceae bacterium]
MLNPESVVAVEAARFGERFVRPLYNGYGFAALPGTIERLLTGASVEALPSAAIPGGLERRETVILLFLDSLGWQLFTAHVGHYPFLQRALDHGVVSRLTTMFPSTTAAHVTTIHTGLPPGQSGIFEWFFHEPSLGRIIAPLLFSYAGERERETLAAAGVDAAALFPTATLYQRLAAAGVHATVFMHSAYAHSSYSRIVCAGADTVAYHTLAEAVTLLSQRLEAQHGPAYYLLYIDTIDALCHTYGPVAPHVAAEIDTVLTILDRLLHPALARLGRPVLLLFTADHGHIGVNPAASLLVNRIVPELADATPTGADGRPLAPGGSNRDLFLYLKPDRVEEIGTTLRERLSGRAEVHRVADLADEGFFGPHLSPIFTARAGDLVVLPYAGEAVWWDDGRFKQRHLGMHGGLTPEEAHTELGALMYGEA